MELINLSTLIKVEGTLSGGREDFAHGGTREGWMFVMPEVEGSALPPMEMLKWAVGEVFFSSASVFARGLEVG